MGERKTMKRNVLMSGLHRVKIGPLIAQMKANQQNAEEHASRVFGIGCANACMCVCVARYLIKLKFEIRHMFYMFSGAAVSPHICARRASLRMLDASLVGALLCGRRKM